MDSYSVGIKVRNKEYYKALETSKDENSTAQNFENWNDGKIPKYKEYVIFGFDFEVMEVIEKKNSCHKLEIIVEKEEEEHKKVLVPIDNVILLQFKGKNKSSYVILAAELLYQGLSPERENKKYLNYYIKEDAQYIRIADNIWLTPKVVESIKESYPKFETVADPHIKIKSESGLMPIYS